MNLKTYIAKSQEFAVYPKERGLEYVSLGLANETLEMLTKVWDGASDEETAKELGDVLWYVGGCYVELQADLPKQFNMPVSKVSMVGTKERLISSLVSEVGEFIGHTKKILRGDPGVTERHKKMAEHLSHILGVIHTLAEYLGTDFYAVMQANYDKLLDRKKRNKLRGDGDNR